MTPEERAKVIRSNRRAYGMEPGTGYWRKAEPRPEPRAIPTPAAAKPPIVSRSGRPRSFQQQKNSVGHDVRLGEFASAFKPPPYVKLVAGIPAVAIGARLPGEPRKRRKR